MFWETFTNKTKHLGWRVDISGKKITCPGSGFSIEKVTEEYGLLTHADLPSFSLKEKNQELFNWIKRNF